MDPEEDLGVNEGGVVTPEELELEDKDGVAKLSEGRYVVSPDGTPPRVSGGDAQAGDTQSQPDTTEEPSPEPTHESTPSQGQGEVSTGQTQLHTQTTPQTQTQQQAEPGTIDREAARGYYKEQLLNSPCEYGYYVSMKSDGVIDHHTLHSDDITMAFNNLLLWYARNVDQEMPPGAVLGILLSEASVPLRYPVKAVEQFLMARGMSTDDTIGDLLKELREEEEIVFPPR